MATYSIYRYYSQEGRGPRLIKRGLTLKKAQEWCNRLDTSSKTHPKGRNGVTCEWFDGYRQE